MSPAIPDPDANRPDENDPEARPTDPAKSIRIGHQERDEAIEVLREAAGDGRITVEELDERMEKVQAAKFPIDLDEVLADLTTNLPSDRFRPQTPGSGLARPPAPGQDVMRPDIFGRDAAEPLVLKAGWESENRRGRWLVPAYIRCEPSMSNIELNFLEVTTDLERIDVEIVGGLGSVVVVVPDDWGVNVDRLSKTLGTVKSSVSAVPQGRKPTIVVGGSIGMGTFRARFANWLDRRRLAK
ncbi:MAG: DUF1707 SHOCT-like domain-containing protein [Brevibacterium sp.]